MSIEHLNPDGVHKSPVFTQGIILPAGCRTLLIGGQNGVDADGQVVAKGDLVKQTERALSNMLAILAAAEADIGDLVSVSIYMADGYDIGPAFAVWMGIWGDRTNPPIVKGFKVAGFINPDVLIEIEATAAFK